MTRAAPALVLGIVLAACVSPRRYMGLDLAKVDVPLQATARAAHAGDKQAQFRLGEWFETGAGLPRDPDRACRLYAQAASTNGGTIYVYSPPVRKGSAGRVIPVPSPMRHGLPAAAVRRVELARRATAEERATSACLRETTLR